MITEILTKLKEIVVYPDGRVDAKNASIYLGLAEKTLAMMRCEGTGPKYVKLGKIFYFLDDLDNWVNAGGRITSTAQHRELIDDPWFKKKKGITSRSRE